MFCKNVYSQKRIQGNGGLSHSIICLQFSDEVRLITVSGDFSPHYSDSQIEDMMPSLYAAENLR